MADYDETDPRNRPEDAEEDTLDLRQLASPTRPVLTSAGPLTLRRMGSLGPLDRTRVMVAQVKVAKRARGLEDLDLAAEDAEERLSAVSEEVREAEDALLRLMLVDVDQETLDALDAPERVGLISAFFGAAPEAARGAVQEAAAILAGTLAPSLGAKRSRGSRGSTARRTRAAG